MLYYAQINSLILYGISMWGLMTTRCLINQIQTLQDKAVKCIDVSLKKDAVYRMHKILTVNQMIKLEMCKLGFRMTKNLLPKPLTKALKTDHCDRSMVKTHRYETRHRAVPNLPKANHSRYRTSYLFQVVSVYSRLPHALTNQVHVKAFTSKCKAYLLE